MLLSGCCRTHAKYVSDRFTGRPLGFVAILGILALIGMIAKNAVILVVQIETDRAEGRGVLDAVMASATGRMRPMMLAAGDLRVVHVSTHVSLRQACDAVTRPRGLKVIELAHDACRKLGITRPRVGVAGLNPHASDGGLFGEEERTHIIPAIADARAKGIDVEGPQPPDTFFAKAIGGAYDICVAMYHDQGHIPVKVLGLEAGVNITVGLDVIRTSVDHGTAFDIAGKGVVDDGSMVEAMRQAIELATRRR